MTAQQEEWTEWFQHDGKGCPCVGQYVQVEVHGNHTGRIWFADGRAGSNGGRSWNWTNKAIWSTIIRYRIRKPRALLDLIQLIADLPAPVAPIKTDGVIA